MAKSNYADRQADNEHASAGPLATEHRIFHHDYRAFTPHGGSNGEHLRGHAFEDALGSSDWRPRAYQADRGHIYTTWVEDFDGGVILAEPVERRAELEVQMPTYRPPRHPRACPSCHLTACLGPDYHELADTQDFQQRARAAHRQAGDYNRHTHDYSIP